MIYGGPGLDGAILAGPGIVPSSGAENRTPWELLVPSALMKAPIVQVGVTWNDALGAPDNPEVVGWWKDGPALGERGNVLLAGHRDYRDINENVGPGALWLLPAAAVGDFVMLRDVDRRVTLLYTVIETTSLPWDSVAGVAYLQPSQDRILTLITCEGSFDEDTSNYSNRRIVVAELTGIVPSGLSSSG